MAGEIVFDIETKNTFDEVGAGNHKGLRVSVAVIYCYDTDEFKIFREETLGELWPILEKADLLIGYNSKYFDVPVLQNYYLGNLLQLPHLDLLEEIKKSAGFRLKLDDVAKATLQTQKSGHGLQAVEWYKAGEWEKIEKYCTDDVRITRDVYEFGKKHKQIFYPDITGGVKPLPVNFNVVKSVDTVGAPAMNLTLPF